MTQKFDFYNLPKKFEEEDYKDAAGMIVERFSNCEGLVSIYDWGNPSVPGISDLDIVLVFGKNAKPLPFSRRSFRFLAQVPRYLARHPFVFIDENSFRNIRYIYPRGSLKLLHGKSLKIKALSRSENEMAEISLLNDIVLRHYPRDFLEQVCSRRINVRDTLLRLNSLRYSAKSLESLTGNKTRWNGKLSLVEKLRKDWFESRNFGQLVSLSEEAISTTLEMVEILRNLIAKRSVEIHSGSSLEYNGIKNKSIFIKEWDRENALDGMLGLAKSGKYVSILPLELSAQLVEYSKYHGPISRHIKNNIKGSISYSIKTAKIVGKRISILNRQAVLANRLKHSDFPAFFDFGYRASSGINNIALKFLDKINFA